MPEATPAGPDFAARFLAEIAAKVLEDSAIAMWRKFIGGRGKREEALRWAFKGSRDLVNGLAKTVRESSLLNGRAIAVFNQAQNALNELDGEAYRGLTNSKLMETLKEGERMRGILDALRDIASCVPPMYNDANDDQIIKTYLRGAYNSQATINAWLRTTIDRQLLVNELRAIRDGAVRLCADLVDIHQRWAERLTNAALEDRGVQATKPREQ